MTLLLRHYYRADAATTEMLDAGWRTIGLKRADRLDARYSTRPRRRLAHRRKTRIRRAGKELEAIADRNDATSYIGIRFRILATASYST